MPKKFCPKCGSDRVEQRIACNSKDDERINDYAADGAEEYYCNHCHSILSDLDTEPYEVEIIWGSESYRADSPDGERITSYCFDSREELDAFMLGVEEANSYLGYMLVSDSRDPTVNRESRDG